MSFPLVELDFKKQSPRFFREVKAKNKVLRKQYFNNLILIFLKKRHYRIKAFLLASANGDGRNNYTHRYVESTGGMKILVRWDQQRINIGKTGRCRKGGGWKLIAGNLYENELPRTVNIQYDILNSFVEFWLWMPKGSILLLKASMTHVENSLFGFRRK